MTVDVDVHLVTKKKGSSTAPEYIFEGYVAVDGPVPRQFRSTEQYRITKVRLLRAQTAVGPEGRPGGR